MGFSTRTLYLLCFASLVAVAPAIAACNFNFMASAEADFAGTGGSSSSAGVGGTGAFDSNVDAAIDVSPAAPPNDTTAPYQGLCGGGCMSNEDGLGCGLTTKDPDGAPAPQVSCRVVTTDDGAMASCLPAGDNVAGEGCLDAADCAPGLGCVEITAGVSVCRQYCCGDVELCPTGTYCAPLPITEDGSTEAYKVPVCIPPTSCTLLDEGACGDGLFCAIVRADGTTSCVPPGLIGENDECPCAEGYVCAKAMNKCLQLCHTGSNSDCPAGSICQGGSKGIPAGFGTCVGGN